MPMPPDTRADVPTTGDERSLLTAFLDFHRQTLEWKCAGLSPTQLAAPSVPPSAMSLLGMVRHLTEVEAGWFRALDGDTGARVYTTPDDPDADWHVDPAAVTEDACVRAWATWRDTVEESRRIVARLSLEDTTPATPSGQRFSVRWILIHMVEEYSRHNGHVDLLRERLDGAVGE